MLLSFSLMLCSFSHFFWLYGQWFHSDDGDGDVMVSHHSLKPFAGRNMMLMVVVSFSSI